MLTPDAQYQAGSVFMRCPIELGGETGFVATMTVLAAGEEGTGGADGFGFIIQASPTGASAVGKVGGDLAFTGVAPAVGVELDSWKNEYDTSDNHIAIVTSATGRVHHHLKEMTRDINDGEPITVSVTYQAVPGTLSIAVDGKPVTGGPIDPWTFVGRVGYLGVVASTGLRRNSHQLLSWSVVATGQLDTDSDGIGDECDPDDDDDGIPDAEDVCPLKADPAQEDSDGDGIGDACDTEDGVSDSDEDGLPDDVEREIGTNPNRADSDIDQIADGDEAPDGVGRDTDGDGFIDALDSDSDGDGVLDSVEVGDFDLATRPVDSDGDGVPDYLDLDSDNDGVPDKTDNCRLTNDPDQADTDQDGVGDVCDNEEGELPGGPNAEESEEPGIAGGSGRSNGAGRRGRSGSRDREGGRDYIRPGARPPAPGDERVAVADPDDEEAPQDDEVERAGHDPTLRAAHDGVLGDDDGAKDLQTWPAGTPSPRAAPTATPGRDIVRRDRATERKRTSADGRVESEPETGAEETSFQLFDLMMMGMALLGVAILGGLAVMLRRR